jgi:hypothetical protein
VVVVGVKRLFVAMLGLAWLFADAMLLLFVSANHFVIWQGNVPKAWGA